jgi:phosphoribosylformylglycinamidine (FGAM) synthase PurS component
MMEAKYYEYGQFMVIEVKGRLEPDQNKPFRDVCERLLKNKEVIFCLNDLSFTASANLTTFFESIQLIPKAKVVGLKTDFHRLLELKGYTKGVRSFKTLHDAIVETGVPEVKEVSFSATIDIDVSKPTTNSTNLLK